MRTRSGNPWPWIFVPLAIVLAGSVGTWLYWMWGGTDVAMIRWMRGPGSVLLLGSALFEGLLCTAAASYFSASQGSRRTWTYLAAAPMARLLGTVLHQWLPALGLMDFPQGTPAFGDPRWIGYVLSGVVTLCLYGLGLRSAMVTYRRFAPLPGLPIGSRLALIPASVFVAHQLGTLLLKHRDQLSDPFAWVNWLTDPLLLCLLYLALRVSAAAGGFAGGLAGRTWFAYAAGFQLMLFGNLGNWLFAMGYLDWIASSPWRWFVWYPAAGALLAGACCQWQACVIARRAWDGHAWRQHAQTAP